MCRPSDMAYMANVLLHTNKQCKTRIRWGQRWAYHSFPSKKLMSYCVITGTRWLRDGIASCSNSTINMFYSTVFLTFPNISAVYVAIISGQNNIYEHDITFLQSYHVHNYRSVVHWQWLHIFNVFNSRNMLYDRSQIHIWVLCSILNPSLTRLKKFKYLGIIIYEEIGTL